MAQLSISIFFLGLSVSPAFAGKKEYSGNGRYQIISGDTLKIEGRIFKLQGIKAPEDGTKWFYASRLYLETLLGSGTSTCQIVTSMKNSEVICGSSDVDAGSSLVLMGMAKSKGQLYRQEEDRARIACRGIWECKK